MNYNRNELTFRHYWNLLREWDNRVQIQQTFDKLRFNQIQKAIGSRPVLIPMQIELNTVGQPQPYNAKTSPFNYDLIVVGYMSDGASRDIILDKVEKANPLVYVGDANSLYLTLDEIAGQPQATNPKGQKGIFYLPSSKLFFRGERLSLDVFQREDLAVGDPQIVNFVIIAYRVFPKSVSDIQFNYEMPVINEYIAKRFAPETVFLKTDVVFDIDGQGGTTTVYTPQLDEPVILKGCRSTMRNCFVEMGLVGEERFTELPVPIWSFAHGDEIPHENYLWNECGIYVPAKIQLRMKCNNTGEAFDPQGINGENTITWIASTV